jgi:hypothetical protein
MAENKLLPTTGTGGACWSKNHLLSVKRIKKAWDPPTRSYPVLDTAHPCWLRIYAVHLSFYAVGVEGVATDMFSLATVSVFYLVAHFPDIDLVERAISSWGTAFPNVDPKQR